jgi:hypothetical protein
MNKSWAFVCAIILTSTVFSACNLFGADPDKKDITISDPDYPFTFRIKAGYRMFKDTGSVPGYRIYPDPSNIYTVMIINPTDRRAGDTLHAESLFEQFHAVDSNGVSDTVDLPNLGVCIRFRGDQKVENNGVVDFFQHEWIVSEKDAWQFLITEISRKSERARYQADFDFLLQGIALE